MRFYGLIMGAVTELVVTILGCVFLGKWLDSRQGTGTRYILVGAIGGFILGFVRLVIRLKPLMNDPGNADD